jgi:hypothetical protein
MYHRALLKFWQSLDHPRNPLVKKVVLNRFRDGEKMEHNNFGVEVQRMPRVPKLNHATTVQYHCQHPFPARPQSHSQAKWEKVSQLKKHSAGAMLTAVTFQSTALSPVQAK